MRRLPSTVSRLPSRVLPVRGPVGPPDYVGLGTSMSGAPWWHNVLLKHPDVERRPPTERALTFFAPFCDREFTDEHVAAYHARFPRRPGKMVGEWSQRYLLDFWTPPLLRRAAPDAKLLVIVSDPIARYRKRLWTEVKMRPADQVAYYMAETPIRGQYAHQLRHLWRYFPPEQTLVLQHERCRVDPVGEYRRTLRFLGLRDDFEPFTRVRARLGTALRRAVARREPRQDLWPELADALRAELEPDVLDLASLVPHLDLDLWPGFEGLRDSAGSSAQPG